MHIIKNTDRKNYKNIKFKGEKMVKFRYLHAFSIIQVINYFKY